MAPEGKGGREGHMRGRGRGGKGSNGRGTSKQNEASGRGHSSAAYGGWAKSADDSGYDKCAAGNASEEELRQRLAAMEATDASRRADEHRVREELKEAEAAKDRAKRREAQAREAVEDSRRRAVHAVERLKGEFADQMSELEEHRLARQQIQQTELASQAELDAMILAQAEAMARRDELTKEVSRLEEQARADEALADKSEARMKHVEAKVKKERKHMDSVKAEMEVLRKEKEDAQAFKRLAQEEMQRCRHKGDLGTMTWRYAAYLLLVSIFFAIFFRCL